jgi:hypothetical protein
MYSRAPGVRAAIPLPAPGWAAPAIAQGGGTAAGWPGIDTATVTPNANNIANTAQPAAP